MASYPVGLPQNFIPESFSLTYAKNSVRRPPSQGPAKSRRMSTSAPQIAKGSVEITAAQYSIWNTFYVTTLSDGTLPFDWTHPIDGSAKEFQYMTEPVISSSSGTNWLVYMELEILV